MNATTRVGRLEPDILLIVTARDEGGAERMAEELVGALRGRCRFTVVLPDVASVSPMAERLSSVARVERLPIDRLSGLARALPRLRALARGADVVHLNSNHPASRLAAVLAWTLGGLAPLVSVEHSGTPPSAVQVPLGYAAIAGAVFRASRRHAVAFVAVSRENEARLVHDYGVEPGRVSTVPNGIDLSQVAVLTDAERHERRRSLGAEDGSRVVLVVARHAPNKGHRFLVGAAPRVLESVPGARFAFVGGGGPDAALDAAIASKGLSGVFTDIGERSRQATLEMIAAADVLVLPSLAEGLPLVVLEAMASGTLVVSSSVGGTPEVIEDGTHGFLAPPGEEVALGDAIVRALTLAPVQRQAVVARARQRAAEFSIDTTAERMMRVYVNAGGRPR